MQSEYPDLAKQWHPNKNAPLTADEVSPHSGQKVWWLCSRGHEWNAVINSRSRGMGCPFCAGQRPTVERNLATENPKLLEEWDWEKNTNKPPEAFTPRSSEKVWWR
ncbi:MAG: zinc-ribbon domain-containing protein [Rhodocyclaceae bacterium]|nr:zinc-ribbon domain-containing protein [Rhodocyclaceae bacterium]